MKTETEYISFSKILDHNTSQRRQKMEYNDTAPFFRFYKPFVITAPILFVLMCIVYVMANIYFYMLVVERKMDVDTANFYIDCFRMAPAVLSAVLLILGAFIARNRREKHIRMIEAVREAEKDKKKFFSET